MQELYYNRLVLGYLVSSYKVKRTQSPGGRVYEVKFLNRPIVVVNTLREALEHCEQLAGCKFPRKKKG